MEKNGIKIVDIFLTKVNFERSLEVIIDNNEKNEVNLNINREENDKMLSINLLLTFKSLYEEKEQLKCEIGYTGLYQLGEEKPAYFEQFCDISAPAMIYPYIRQELGLLTLKSLLKPIYLPPFNFIALKEKEKKNGEVQ